MSAADFALSVAKEYGWRVFPLKGKKPFYGTNGFKDASADPATIRKMFAEHPGATGYGIATGGDLLVVDFDPKNGGMESKAALEEKHGLFPATVEVATGGGGLHLYYRVKHSCRSTAGRIAPGVDTRGDGGYVAGPGSIHPDTSQPYTWQASPDARAIADAPQWLLNKMVTERAKISESHSVLSASSALSDLSALSVTPLTEHEVIQMTLPKRPGIRHTCVLKLARGLWFNADMAKRPLPELKPIVHRWHDKAKSMICTKDFDETWSDFVHAWEHPRVPLGHEALSIAWKQSQTDSLPAAAAEYDSEPVRRLIGFCAALARPSPDGRFFLSTHVAAPLFDVDPTQIYRWLNMLTADGHLEVIQKGDPRLRRATRYRWKESPVAGISTHRVEDDQMRHQRVAELVHAAMQKNPSNHAIHACPDAAEVASIREQRRIRLRHKRGLVAGYLR